LEATCTVGFCEFNTISGQKKSFQACRNVSMPSTAIAGRTAGSTTERKTLVVEAPSMYAASMSSSGTALEMYCRMKKTPKAVTSVGRITEERCPARPHFAISM
jgi:hypothetical protein